MEGRTLGRFRILEKLGQGGMATVWKALDTLTGAEVAFKALSSELAAVPKARHRFLREARDAARLDHPGIAPVLGWGEESGTPYIVFELVEGQTWAQRIAHGPAECDEAVRIAVAAARALGHAHERGIVHRDVTSRNIMIRNDGGVMLIDFGIALTDASTRLTSRGTTLGTVAYLAPEVVEGADATPSSDLYSLTVVLYEALTGHLPYRDRHAGTYTFAIVHEPPTDPGRWRHELSPTLRGFLLRSLAKDPAARPGDAEEYARLLREATVEPASPAPDGNAVWIREDAHPPQLPIPAYVAVLPFEYRGTTTDDGSRAALARGLAAALESCLGGIPGVHLVPQRPFALIPEGNLARIGRQLGANVLVGGVVAREGSEVRVSWSVVLPHDLVSFAGGQVDGSLHELFHLEDRLAEAVRRALGAEPATPREGSLGRDPAAREHFLQALGYLRRHDHPASIDGAIGLLERLLATEGPSAERLTALARAYLSKHRLTFEPEWERRTETMCQRAYELDPDNVEVAVALGDLRSHVGRREFAIADYARALKQVPDHPGALSGMASALRAAGRYDEAVEFARRAVETQPGHWRHLNVLGLIQMDQGDYVASVDSLLKAAKLVPDSARIHYNLGSVHFYSNDMERAASAYRCSIEIAPSSAAYVSLGTVYFSLGRHDQALESFRRGLALGGPDPRVWAHVGSALRWAPGRESESREPLERAVELLRAQVDRHGGSSDDWSLLASCLSNLGRHDAAIAAIDHAVRLSGRRPTTLLAAAAVYELAGDRIRALECATAVLRHGDRTGMLMREPALAELVRTPEISSLLGSSRATSANGLTEVANEPSQ